MVSYLHLTILTERFFNLILNHCFRIQNAFVLYIYTFLCICMNKPNIFSVQ